MIDSAEIARVYGRHDGDMGGAVQLAMLDARIADLRERHLSGRHRMDAAAGKTLLKLMRRRTRVMDWLRRKRSDELRRYLKIAALDPDWRRRHRREGLPT